VKIPGAALEAQGVVKRYGKIVALAGVSIEVTAGSCVALIGESGSGKSTLLRCFNKLTTPDTGQVLVDGADIANADAVALRRRVGYVPQDGGLLPHWRVARNVALVPWLNRSADPSAPAATALQLVGLDPRTFGRRWPHELSGGQRQRVAIARALAARPNIILLDEPFGALDAITRSELQQTFASLRHELAVTTLLVTHDLREALLLADSIAVMREGAIEQHAPGDELRRAPATPYVEALLRKAGVT
jgi:osmoprotectant transport system ATP-binding protein